MLGVGLPLVHGDDHEQAVMAKSMPLVSMGSTAPATAPITEPRIQ